MLKMFNSVVIDACDHDMESVASWCHPSVGGSPPSLSAVWKGILGGWLGGFLVVEYKVIEAENRDLVV